MATLYSQKTGNWSDAAAMWNTAANGSGTYQACGTGDVATIQSGHTVTVDTTTCVCSTFTIQSGGTLTGSPTVNSKLSPQTNGTINHGGNLACDLSASATPVLTIAMNASGSTASLAGTLLVSELAGISLKGYPRTRVAQLTSGLTGGTSVTCTVSDATGWQVGDTIVFATTQAYNATPKTDVVTLNASYTPGSTTLTWTGAVTNDHAIGGRVGNFSSNIVFAPDVAGRKAQIRWSHGYATTGFMTKLFSHVLFSGSLGDNYQTAYAVVGAGESGSSAGNYDIKFAVQDCAFLNNYGPSVGATQIQQSFVISGCVSYSDCFNSGAGQYVLSAGYRFGNISNCHVFRTTGAASSKGGFVLSSYVGGTLTDCSASGCVGTGIAISVVGGTVIGGESYSNGIGINFYQGNYEINGFDLGTHNSGAATNSIADRHEYLVNATLTDCNTQTLSNNNLASCIDGHRISWVSKNNSVITHEIYEPTFQIKRDNSNNYRSTSSVAIYPTVISTDCQRTLSIPCANGSSVTVIGYVKKSHATNISATVAITGLGSSVTPFTKANDTNWEQYTLTATNSSGNDGNFTLTYTANSSSGTANVVYFDGVPDAPFVTVARQYGKQFPQTTPNALANDAVVANEATALGYSTKFSVTGGASQSDVALTASATFQQLYDYTQAWSCTTTNLAYAIPCTSPAGSGNLIAAGDVDCATYTLNGSGSLAMGGKTLTASVPFSYTYTGGTFSQAVSIPSFSGGTLNIGAAGVYVFDTAGTIIINMTPAGVSPPNYDLDSITANGVVDLRNTTAHAITVELSSAVAALAITSNNTGGTITVTAPVVTADISITGIPNVDPGVDTAPTRLQIINQTAAAAADWQAATVYAAGDVVLRTSGVGSENTAGLYMRCTAGGTSGGTEPTWDTTVGNTTADNTVTWTTYAILYYSADPAATSLTDTYIDGKEFLAGETIEIRFAEEDPAVSFETYSTSVIATAAGFSALVSASADSVYATYGLSGAAQDSIFSPNFVANYIVLDANINFAGSSAYAYYCYLLTTDDGMYRFWGGLTGIDPGNIRNNVSVISLYFDETAGFVRQTDDVRIFRSDGARPALDPTTGGSGIEINWKVPVNVVTTGGSAVLPQDVIDIADAVWAKTLP